MGQKALFSLGETAMHKKVLIFCSVILSAPALAQQIPPLPATNMDPAMPAFDCGNADPQSIGGDITPPVGVGKKMQYGGDITMQKIWPSTESDRCKGYPCVIVTLPTRQKFMVRYTNYFAEMIEGSPLSEKEIWFVPISYNTIQRCLDAVRLACPSKQFDPGFVCKPLP